MLSILTAKVNNIKVIILNILTEMTFTYTDKDPGKIKCAHNSHEQVRIQNSI